MNKYQEALANILFYCGHANYDKYLNPKVFEELKIIQELVDKATPKKVIIRAILYCNCNNGECDNGFIYHCPVCNICDVENMNYCPDCGQALDWSGKDD